MHYHFVHFQKSMIIVQRSSNVTITIDSLNPITNYTVAVQCKLANAKYWSTTDASVLFSTESASKLYIFLFFCPLQLLCSALTCYKMGYSIALFSLCSNF